MVASYKSGFSVLQESAKASGPSAHYDSDVSPADIIGGDAPWWRSGVVLY
jgi:hypothetical protein